MADYLLQESGSACWLYALANAAIYFGKAPPLPGTPGWEWLMDVGMCRHGTCIGSRAIALQLGLDFVELASAEAIVHYLPGLLQVWNHDGGGMHIVLAIDGKPVEVKPKLYREGVLIPPEELTLVNYRWGEGPVVETLKWEDISMPDEGNVNRRAFQVTLSEREPPEITMCPFCNAWWYPHEDLGGRTSPWHHTTCPRHKG